MTHAAISRLLLSLALAIPALAQHQPKLHGTVHDPLGSAVANGAIDLLQGDRVLASAKTGPDGTFHFDLARSGRYRVRVGAASFETTTSGSVYVAGSADAEMDVTLATHTLTQQVTVTATGVPMPEAQTGASVTVLPAEEYRTMLEVQDPLRLVPGVQMTQSGQMGGTTGLFIRGGATDANKVLIDGVPANTIGGGVEFANLATTGVDSIEVLREPNSALYGSDALAGVVSIATTRGTTRLPLFTYAGDAGNFGTYRNEVTGGGTYRGFDLYSTFARIDTRNDIPGSEFHNATYAGNFGWAPNAANDLRFTVRHVAVSAGEPNAIAFYGIADDARQKEQDDYYNAAWNNQTTPRWHNQVRYGGLRQNGEDKSFGATGIPDGYGDFDGKVVTITGANGYSVTGQAVFQYSDQPSVYLTPARRDFVDAQSDFRATPHFLALAGFKFEAESGSSGYAGETPEKIQRGNYSYTLQLSGDIRNRLFYSVGTGLEDNGLFSFAGTPRASLAYYLFRPAGAGVFSGTKLRGSFGKGIKEPSIFQQTDALYGPNIAPLGPETSRTFDGGVDQQLFHSRGRVGLTYFHNEFTNGVQNVPQKYLPTTVAANFPYGAYLNGAAFRSMGLEFEAEARLGSHLFARAGYTYTDAVVQQSVAVAAKGTAFKIPIGAYAPLVGARPFRVAPHTGYFALNYTRSKWFGSLTGTLVGRRDDSDFLSDANFGNTLLLPNRNLDGGYQRLELGGGYQATRRLNLYADVQNLLSEHYYEAFGYPALPLTFRAGVKVNFGGESWKP